VLFRTRLEERVWLFQINRELEVTQRKVDNSTSEITRISNELEPKEVREGEEREGESVRTFTIKHFYLGVSVAFLAGRVLKY